MKPILRTPALLAVLLAAGIPLAASAALNSAGAGKVTGKRIEKILKRMQAVHRFGSVAISPDGRNLAWTEFGKGGAQLEIADANGSHVRHVSLGKTFKGCGIENVSWAPHGKQLAFLSNCGNGKKNAGQNDIYTLNVGAGKLTAHQLTHLKGFVHDLTYAPNGHRFGILYVEGDTHRVAATAATKARVGVIGVSNVEHQGMAVVNAANGRSHTVTPESLFVYGYSWAPQSSRIAFVAAPPPGADNWWTAKLYIQAIQNNKPTVILDPNTVKGSLHGLQIAVPRWSPNGMYIALIGGLMSDHGATGGDVYVLPSIGGTPVDVTPGIDESPSWLTWTGNANLLVSAIASGKIRVSEFALHGNKVATQTPLMTVDSSIGDGTVASALSLSAGHYAFAFTRSTFTEPPEVYYGRFMTNKFGQPTGIAAAPHAVTDVNAGVKPVWGKGESIEWTNDGHHVQGWLLLPAHYDPHKTYPMIVHVHGGPVWAVQPRWGGGGSTFSALGYFVLMPNPRGSLGEGEAYTQAVRKDMGYGDLRDVLAGVDTVEKKFPIDNNRLGLTGWSYGGFMSMFAPTQTHRFRAAVAGAGLSDWLSYYGENMIDKWMIPFFGTSVYNDPKVYAKSSAINFIKQDKTPTLVVVGQHDAECPAPQSFEFWHGLRAQGVPTQLVVYAGEGHGFHKKKDRIDVMKRSLAWFQKYLGT